MDGVGAEVICAKAGPAAETVAAMTRSWKCFMTRPREGAV
jgi:hypothetical protein